MIIRPSSARYDVVTANRGIMAKRDAPSCFLSDLSISRFASYEEFVRYRRDSASENAARRAREIELAVPHAEFHVPGRCPVCDRDVDFSVDWAYSYEVEGRLTPNWREQLICPSCKLNNRMRATVFLYRALVGYSESTRLYMTEQLTPLFGWFKDQMPGTFGSESLGDFCALGGVDARGLRNEDIRRLSFDDEAFDSVICLDVLEHVPEYRKGLTEICRVLRLDGSLMLSVPLLLDRRHNLVRAQVNPDGTTTHHEPPEYHGDPLSEEGCLAFYHFGWSLMDDLRDAGFSRCEMVHYWSQWYGFLGADQVILMARRAEHRTDR